MSAYASVVLVCLLLVAAVVHLLRTRRIREKYAAIWILLTAAVLVVGAFPQLTFWLSRLVGIRTPANLVFAIAIVVLLAVCIQLSAEVSNLEEETRTLAQEIALQRLDARSDREATLRLLQQANLPRPPATASEMPAPPTTTPPPGGLDPIDTEQS